jgi:glycosyltransferase involved in cell wall biosynthesis
MTRPERVLFLLSRVLGGKTFTANLMRAVGAIEHIRPHYVFLDEDDYRRYRPMLPYRNRLTNMFLAPSIMRLKLRADPPPPCDSVFVQSFELMPALRDIDPARPVILAHDSTNVLSYRLIRDTSPGLSSKIMYALKSALVTPYYRGVLRRARAFLPRTHWCADSLVRDFGVERDRIIVTPGGLDTDLWRPDRTRERKGPPILIWVGNDFERKGGHFLIDLFVKYLHPRARLRIVSNDPGLKGRAWPAGVEHLSGLGHKAPNELVEAYRSADIFVFPTRKEHMGMVLSEACAVGLPIVGTDVGGVGEGVRDGENGILMPYDAGEEAWAGAILELIGNPALRERYGAHSRKIAEREFSHAVLRQRVESAFAKLA